MSKTLLALNTLAVGILLLGDAPAQQTPAPKAQPAAAAKTQPATPAKTQASTSAKPKTAAKTGTAAKAPGLTSQKAKFSYALGMIQGKGIGGNLHKLSVDVDPNLAAQGFKDGLSGGKTQITDEEARAVLMTVQNDLQQKMEAKMKAQGEANLKEGTAFLAANKAKEGVVTLPSGLQYKVITQGTGAKPTDKDTVICNYRGTLIDGTEFDSSSKHGQPATFVVSRIIKGWTEALQLMPVGSKWQLFIPPDLAYGERAPSEIGPNSTLIFEVELLSIKAPEPSKPADELKPAEPSKPAEPNK